MNRVSLYFSFKVNLMKYLWRIRKKLRQKSQNRPKFKKFKRKVPKSNMMWSVIRDLKMKNKRLKSKSSKQKSENWIIMVKVIKNNFPRWNRSRKKLRIKLRSLKWKLMLKKWGAPVPINLKMKKLDLRKFKRFKSRQLKSNLKLFRSRDWRVRSKRNF